MRTLWKYIVKAFYIFVIFIIGGFFVNGYDLAVKYKSYKEGCMFAGSTKELCDIKAKEYQEKT